MITIVTAYDDGAADEFARLRRKRWVSRDFVVAGEWSESPFHQGRETFAVSATPDRRFWALLNVSFPTRIVAVAEVDRDVSLEEIAAEMMWAVEEKGGPYIDGVHDYGEIDAEAFWEFYDAARERLKVRNQEEAKVVSETLRLSGPPCGNEAAPPADATPPTLPPDAVLVCAYDLYVGIDNVDEEAWFRRAEGNDELWTRCLGTDRKVVSQPSVDDPGTAARRLLEGSIRGAWGFEHPTRMLRPGLVGAGELDGILATILADLERNDAAARSHVTPIVEVARELGLGPEPTGTGPVHWQARCPGTNHPLYIQAETGTFGCGWCKRKGGEAELREFVAERRAGTKA